MPAEGSTKGSKPPVYLTIDFEDIGTDMLRMLGLDPTARAREAVLARTYEDIRTFARDHLGGRPMTFFCTGVLGLYAKDVVAEIARDGHEIACHYHFHDPVFADSPVVVDRRAAEAIESLEAASGSEILGFRAPMFSIRREHVGQYQALARRFRYDSSLIADVDEAFDESAHGEISDSGRMRLFPVPKVRKLRRIGHKAGGTFFKFFPLAWTLDALSRATQAGAPPVFYIHPYEFTSDGRFKLSRRQLAPLGSAKQTYWWLRQSQWHDVGNAAVMAKLKTLAAQTEHQGNMRDLLSV